MEIYSVAPILLLFWREPVRYQRAPELGLSENRNSWGLEHSLMYDGTRDWQGSASNVSCPAIHCSEQSVVCECLPLAPACVLRELQHRLQTAAAAAAANALVSGHTVVLEESRHLSRRLREWSRDLRT